MNQKMIFIVGNSRSGTTMMGRVLGNHPDIFTFGELHFFEQLWTPGSKELLSRDQQTRLAARLLTIQRDGFLLQGDIRFYLTEAELVVKRLPEFAMPPAVFSAFLTYEADRNGKSIACDQTPRNAFFLKEIFGLFPNAYVINMVRDPRDVLLSQKNKWRRRFLVANAKVPWTESIRVWANYHPLTVSLLWNANLKAVLPYQNHPRFHQLRFEAFVNSPEQELKQLCEWLELEYFPEMLLVPQINSSHGRDQPENLGINPRMAGRWQLTAAFDQIDYGICQFVCRKNMLTLNYKLAPIRLDACSAVLSWLTWPIKITLATFLNLGRSRNIYRSIERRLRPIIN